MQKKYTENFVHYFPPSKYGMIESVSTQKIFHTIAVHNKAPIEKIGIS